MVEKGQQVDKQWAQVEVQYQRRMDLIPNLVETVKGYAKFEASTLTEITALRASVGKANVTFKDANATVDNKVAAVNAMETGLGRLMVIMERYPDLKANQGYLQLQAELAGTENRVAQERRGYNEMISDYNTYIMKFPSNILANMYGFKARLYFAADKGAEKAPSVKF